MQIIFSNQSPVVSSSEMENLAMGEERFGLYDMTALSLLAAVIVSLIIIALWSLTLLALDKIEGGGPLGYFMQWIIAFLL